MSGGQAHEWTSIRRAAYIFWCAPTPPVTFGVIALPSQHLPRLGDGFM